MPTGRADGDIVCVLPCVFEVRNHGGVLTGHPRGQPGRHMGDKQKEGNVRRMRTHYSLARILSLIISLRYSAALFPLRFVCVSSPGFVDLLGIHKNICVFFCFFSGTVGYINMRRGRAERS